MQRLRNLFADDDSAVSPVIGVILMVAITVILAAVIASFVLGLGGNNEPAPSPTISSSVDGGADNITLDVTGGDDFAASDATIQVTVDGDSSDNIDMGTLVDGDVTAGTSITINATDSSSGERLDGPGGSEDSPNFNGGNLNDVSWEVEIIYNPADQDSTVIFSDSSS